jgi:hypothetical protein
MKPDWMARTFTFSWLARYAAEFAHYRSTFEWLKAIGVVPNDVESMRTSQVQVKLDLDPERIEAGYLAAVAYEWDSWGESSPTDLIFALECELKDSPQRDAVATILLALGRAASEDRDGLAVAAA